MKCPHCNVTIHDAPSSVQICEHFRTQAADGTTAPHVRWAVNHQRCPSCCKAIMFLESFFPENSHRGPKTLVYPPSSERPVPSEVLDPYRQDFVEASRVLSISPKASAALSRRCLQAVLKEYAKTKAKDLFDQIEEVTSSGKLPSHIADDLHAVRNIGNFAAHPLKSTSSGAIIDIEAGEAEWNLDVLELLFDFYFVQPAISARRRAELNKKLTAAGKPVI